MEDGSVRILVVAGGEEDYAEMRALLAEAGRMKFDVEWTTACDAALESIKRKRHDVYLLDCRLKERSGLKLLREAAAFGCKAPIIILTDRNNHEKAMKAGAADYLVKGELSAPLLERSIRYALERKQAEEALEKALDAAFESACVKSEFLANMNHEMKTPLNAVIGMIDLVLDSDLTHGQHENLMLARFSADSLLHLINDILGFSSTGSGKSYPGKGGFSLRQTLEKALSPLQLKAEQKGLRLVKRVPTELPDLLVGDAARLSQVLTKLAENAVKFTERGEVAITVEMEGEDESEVVLHWVVDDTGMGIPADRIEKIFQAFTQGDGSLSRKHGGAGLGLSVVRSRVAALGGKVWVESEVGRGSRFHFTAKFGVQNGESAAVPAERGVFADSATGENSSLNKSLKILLADDSQVNQMMFSEMLGKNGHAVTVVANGRRAVEAFQKEKFDIVLMDIQMPEMDGYEATTIIRAQEATTGTHVPIIALTGSDFQGDREKCLNRGMDGYLAKPLSERELLAALPRFAPTGQGEAGGEGTPSLPGETPPATELLDTEAALENLGGNRELLREITALFLKEAPGQIKQLREAVVGRDEEWIERSAHKLKGMASHVGAGKIADEAFRIQLAVRKGDREKPAYILQNIEWMFGRLKEELSGFDGREGGPLAPRLL